MAQKGFMVAATTWFWQQFCLSQDEYLLSLSLQPGVARHNCCWVVAFAVKLFRKTHEFVNWCHKCKVLLILRGSFGLKVQRSFKILTDIVFTVIYHTTLILVWTFFLLSSDTRPDLILRKHKALNISTLKKDLSDFTDHAIWTSFRQIWAMWSKNPSGCSLLILQQLLGLENDLPFVLWFFVYLK